MLWDVEARIAKLAAEVEKPRGPRPDVFISGVTDRVDPREAELAGLRRERAAIRRELGLPEFELVPQSSRPAPQPGR